MPEAPNPKLRPTHPAPHTPGTVSADHAYAELEVTTNFSFLRGASHPDELVYRAAELGYRAVSVTDINSLAGVVRAHEAAKQANLKLIVGTRLVFTDAPDVLVWVTDRAAYARLCRLLTVGKRRAEKGQCTLHLNDLLNDHQGFLAGFVPPGPASRDWVEPLLQLKDAMGKRLSLVTRCDYDGKDDHVVRSLATVSRDYGVPLLASNNAHYHDPSRRLLQDVVTCIRHGCTLHNAGFKLFANGERYLKSPEQMHRLFQDHPHAIRRGLDVVEQCSFNLSELRYEYPDELAPPGSTTIEYLSELAWRGAVERYPQGVPEKVRTQIAHELVLIEKLKFPAYFLTVYDLVRFARSRGILCQGRGSAANSAVCYCIGITSVDPARIDLLFERFVSTARDEPPDIDVDFEHERREEVIQYVYEKYGRDRAGMTAEVISYRGRSAVRDVGKALGLGLDTVDQIAKRLDGWQDGKLPDEQLRAVGLDPADLTVRLLVDRTSEILGFPRHLSQHVGGMIITRGPLCELVPIENASMTDRTVIEWDKDDIDALGILKVDLLALGMLTCISKGLSMLNDRRPVDQPKLELYSIPAEDPAVYDMISDADTVGVFQIESRAQMSMLPRLRPRTFYDLVIEVAIVRPGPIQGGMVHPYLRRRNGEEPVVYEKPELEAVLGKTLGVPLFQEQAMKVVMVAASFSAEDADRLRRAMAAWRYNGKIEQFHQKMLEGMRQNGYTDDFSERLFQQIKGFGEYGFPESHAASFALLVYASCWMKRHHPAVFACALLNSQPMGFYAPAQIVRDTRAHGVTVCPIDVNYSNWDCTLEDDDAPPEPAAPHEKGLHKSRWGCDGPMLRLGFRLIRGMREVHARRIVACRARTEIMSVEQFHEVTRLPASCVERLAEADAFSSLPQSRRGAMWDSLVLKDQVAPLFDDRAGRDEPVVMLPKMPLGQEVMADYTTAGLSLKQHPVGIVRAQLKQQRIITAQQLGTRDKGWASVAGVVLVRQRPGTASGIVFITLEDETGIVNLIVRPDIYERHRAVARHAALLRADGYVERKGQVIHLMVKRLVDLSELLSGYAFKSRDFH